MRLDRIRLERARSFGDVWLGWTLWRALKLDEFCDAHMPEGREAVAWSAMASILVIARLCEPSSELHIAEDWYRRTALEDLLRCRASRSTTTGCTERSIICSCTRRPSRSICGSVWESSSSLDYDLLLYDVTSTYFEGLANRNPQAKRGHSRDHRPDCKQVCIALVVTREGIPLGYEVFDGNRVDVTTVEEIVGTMEARFGLAGRIWVMDRGMTSADNLAWLQRTNRRYLIGTPKSDLKKWSREIADAKDWRLVREGVEAKLCLGPEGAETFVLCRSADRQKKEKAMHERFSARIEERLASLLAVSSTRVLRSNAGPSSVKSVACSARTHALRRATRSVSSTIRMPARSCDSSGRLAPNGTIGRATPRAATCCAPTSAIGRPRRSGEPTSS